MIESDIDKSEREKEYDNYIPTSSSQTTSDEDEKEKPIVKDQNRLLNTIEETRKIQPYLNQVSNPLTKIILFDMLEKDSFKIPKQNLCKSKLHNFLEILDKFPIRNLQKEMTNHVNMNTILSYFRNSRSKYDY